MLTPLLVLLFGAAALGLVVVVLRDSRRKGYPAGYRRGRPLPAHPVQRLAQRPPRRPPMTQRGSARPNLGPPPRVPVEPRSAPSAPARETAQPPRPTPPRPERAYADRGAAALEEGAGAPATRVPAGTTPPPPRRQRPTPQVPAALATGAAGAWDRTRETATLAVSRSRKVIATAATSPRTKRATQTAREWVQRAAAATGDGLQRFSVFTREQFERDPRRAGIVAAAVGVGVVVILLLGVMALTGGGDGPSPDGGQPSGGAVSGGATQPAGAATAPGVETATPAPTAPPAPLAGAPYNETSMTSALGVRGVTPAVLNEAYPCAGATTTPRTFEVTGPGGEQQYVLLVYADSAGMNGDWVIGGGRPVFRNGTCAADAETIYFNANVLLVLPDTTSAELRTQIVDAFLAMQ